ncbi:MAG: MFS transporter [Bryobacteraceae bacterium]
MLTQGFSRWIPTLSMLLVSLISYIDRNTLALLAPTILKETNLSAEQYGFIISGFSIAYMISNPLWGRVLDRFGLRWGMFAAVLFWTFASMSHALAAGFASFAIARIALGMGEGATFPGGLRAVMQTLPVHQQARGIALSYSGGSMGAIVTPILITPIALAWGWRSAFLFTGIIGLAWLIHWYFVGLRPDVRHWQPPSDRLAAKAAPRFTHARLWSFMIAYACCGLPLAFVLYSAALYLNQAMGLSQAFIGKVLWIPPLGWEVGYFFWGWLVDRMSRSGLSSQQVVWKLMTAAAVLALPLALVPWIPWFWLVMLELFFAMFLAGGNVILTIRYATQIYSPDHAGLIAGLGAGAWGAGVALAMPVFGRLFDLHRYDLAFALATAFPILGYLVWAGINLDLLRPVPRAHPGRTQGT